MTEDGDGWECWRFGKMEIVEIVEDGDLTK